MLSGDRNLDHYTAPQVEGDRADLQAFLRVARSGRQVCWSDLPAKVVPTLHHGSGVTSVTLLLACPANTAAVAVINFAPTRR
jgi:hypothetical protein